MTPPAERERSTLEYIILGLIGTSPQSGYSIISMLEAGTHRWSASPGSIYPILKRLEHEGLIVGELDMVYETRPRKMYRLTPPGEETLDDWLRSSLAWSEVLDERDIALIKFLFAENRLTREEVLVWLDAYEKQTDEWAGPRRVFSQALISEASLHQQLIYEMTLMELNMQRTWIQMARSRIEAEMQREGGG